MNEIPSELIFYNFIRNRKLLLKQLNCKYFVIILMIDINSVYKWDLFTSHQILKVIFRNFSINILYEPGKISKIALFQQFAEMNNMLQNVFNHLTPSCKYVFQTKTPRSKRLISKTIVVLKTISS